MCGILLIHSKRGPLDREKCSGSLEKLKKRGPDFFYSHFEYDDRLFLGQTILSITGSPKERLSSFHKSDSGRFDIIFNGEIYNYNELGDQFLQGHKRSNIETDTEILVKLFDHLPATELYQKLDGMFCFAVLDNKRKSVILGRDLLGEKIGYYYENEEFFILCSELGPIIDFVSDIKINKEVLKEYFFTRHLLTTEDSVFNGIKLLTPGTLSEYSLETGKRTVIDQIQFENIVDPELIEERRKKGLASVQEEFNQLFKDICRTMVPLHVDYSCIFSGGIDSSLCGYFFQQHKTPEDLITLVFPGKDQISCEIDRFSPFLKKDLKKIEINPEIFAEHMEASFRGNCSPIATHSFISQFLVSKYVKETGVKVLIGGDGADELFGGYEFYKKIFTNMGPEVPLGNPSPYSGFAPCGISFEGFSSQKLEDRLNFYWRRCLELYSFEKLPQERTLQSMLACDTLVELESVGIRSSDKMSMLNSVEARSPFLRKDVVRFALNLPIEFKIDPKNPDDRYSTKLLLKTLFKDVFSDDLVYQKQGFSGYPNEAAEILLKGDYSNFEEALKPTKGYREELARNRALEWKVMNTELFLRYFNQYL
jgi:asparagine synthase (glutamine-hydrolysing)